MTNECKDRDLLAIEPTIFVGGGFPAQTIVAAADGQIAGTTFSSPSSDFLTRSVAAGMVLCVWTTTSSEGQACEIVSVDSQTQLTISVLRADPDAPPVAPSPATGLSFHVRTFGPQVHAVAVTLAEKMRQIWEAAGINTAEFADSNQLRQTITYGSLAGIFTARAANASDGDANWIKAEHYRRLFQTSQLQLRLAVDADGDGTAEQTRSLGNVTLRRV